LEGIEPSLENCRQLLQHARLNTRDWEVIHIQHSNGKIADCFNPNTEYFQFADDFTPTPTEHHYVKMDYSCYSSPEFSAHLDEIMHTQKQKIYMAGYNSVMCCLSTLEEARRRKHEMIFVGDASLAKAIAPYTEAQMHEIMLSLYRTKGLAPILQAQAVLECTDALYSDVSGE
jgi:nicotinamidase-related amidase